MKKKIFQSKSILVFAICTTPLLAALPAFAADTPNSSSCYPISLRVNPQALPSNSFIQIIDPPSDSNGDGWFETVLKIKNVNNPAVAHAPRKVKFLITYTDTPFGLTVNIGDSETNDGFSGDGATQSNDAEIQIGNLPDPFFSDTFPNLFVYGRDGTVEKLGQAQLEQVYDVASKNATTVLTVSNQGLDYVHNDTVSGAIRSSQLFALNGQPDTEGPVNYDIYAAFNRSIGSAFRSGKGVAQVQVCLLDK
ncbi:MAG: hypothetical protein KME16_07970 [Scytolyngbya sp. HA4215-MV1]|jgi:hypothetical protein|nr:hypothetical protein [Scytolyngbya sp. HA4215-MV1]